MNSLRLHIVKFAAFLNRKTWFLDGIKNRLGLTDFALKVLSSPLNGVNVARMTQSLDTSHISRQVDACKASGQMPVFWILLTQSLGDIIACEPIARYLKRLVPDSKVNWIVIEGFRSAIDCNPYIDEILTVSSLTEGKQIAVQKAANGVQNIIVDCMFDGTGDPLARKTFHNPINPQICVYTYYLMGNLLECFSLAAGLPKLDDTPIFHFGKDASNPLVAGAGRIVFHCRASEDCRNWDDVKWNRLANVLVESGREIVEVGIKRVLRPRAGIIDFTGRQRIQHIAQIIRDADLFIGVDSAFAHVANATRTSSVILLGKFRNFASYCPYSGKFARSEKFKILRAPNGLPCAEIDVASVLNAVVLLLQGGGAVDNHNTAAIESKSPLN